MTQHPPVIDYAQPPRPMKPETRRHGDTVEIVFPPLPPVMRRVLGEFLFQQERRLILQGDLLQFPGGIIRATCLRFVPQQSSTYFGATELVAWPPKTDEGHELRRRRRVYGLLWTLNNGLNADGLLPEEEPVVLLYGNLQDDFTWTAGALHLIAIREARRAAGGDA